MTPNEAASIISSISDSLRSQPNQFVMNVNITGQQVTSHGGTGLSISVQGGGAGSHTIGQSVSASSGNLSLSQGQADAALTEMLRKLASEIDTIAEGLRTKDPDSTTLWARFRTLANKWAPAVVTTVIEKVLTNVLGPA